MANLLGLRESFLWDDASIDRNTFIDNLNLAIIEARDYGDEVYGTPNFFEFDGEWGDFMIFIYETVYDDEARINRFPWLNQLQHTTLVRIFDFFQNLSPHQANNRGELVYEFPNSNNGDIGCYCNQLPVGAVHDQATWNDFHRRHVSAFTFQQRQEQFDYFIQFYQPRLTRSLNQIQQVINQGNANPIIQGIHNPLIPHEQIHVHFNTNVNCALNIDGTWKHEANGFSIPMEACENLTEWGFLLPHHYYQL